MGGSDTGNGAKGAARRPPRNWVERRRLAFAGILRRAGRPHRIGRLNFEKEQVRPSAGHPNRPAPHGRLGHGKRRERRAEGKPDLRAAHGRFGHGKRREKRAEGNQNGARPTGGSREEKGAKGAPKAGGRRPLGACVRALLRALAVYARVYGRDAGRGFSASQPRFRRRSARSARPIRWRRGRPPRPASSPACWFCSAAGSPAGDGARRARATGAGPALAR